MRPRHQVAPLWLRVLAGGVDVGLVLTTAGALVAAAVRWASGDFPSARTERVLSALRSRSERVLSALRSPCATWALRLGGDVALLPTRNWRSPGYRLAAIRTVDARTGGPVSVRSELVGQLVTIVCERLTRRALAPVTRAHERRHEAARRRIEEARRAHEGPEAAERAVMEAIRSEQVSCLPALATGAAPSALRALSALLSPRRQTVDERLAGVVVVRDRRGRR